MKKYIAGLILFSLIAFVFIKRNSLSEVKPELVDSTALIFDKENPLPKTLNEKELVERKIASLPANSDEKIKTQPRQIIGNKMMPKKIHPTEQASVWKKRVGDSLLRIHPKGTEVVLQHELELIEVRENEGHPVEQIVVTYLQKDKPQSSFRAHVDPKTGEILRTWDRTIHENIRKPKLKLTPSGTL
jgi:hypothetical protein